MNITVIVSHFCIFTGSHSFSVLASFIKGQTPFPQLSFTAMLDDVRVLYYNGDTDTFFARGNTTNEDSLFDPDLKAISDYIDQRWAVVDHLYKPKGKHCALFFTFTEESFA